MTFSAIFSCGWQEFLTNTSSVPFTGLGPTECCVRDRKLVNATVESVCVTRTSVG